VTHADDVRPANFWMLALKLSGDLACSLADRLDEMNQSKTKILIAIECGPRDPLLLATAFFAMPSMWPA